MLGVLLHVALQSCYLAHTRPYVVSARAPEGCAEVWSPKHTPVTDNSFCGPNSVVALLEYWGEVADANEVYGLCSSEDGNGTVLGCLAKLVAQRGLFVCARRAGHGELRQLVSRYAPFMAARATDGAGLHYELVLGFCGDELVIWSPDGTTYLIREDVFLEYWRGANGAIMFASDKRISLEDCKSHFSSAKD